MATSHRPMAFDRSTGGLSWTDYAAALTVAAIGLTLLVLAGVL